MANIFRYGPHIPVIHPSAYVHPNATVTGNVTIGANVYIGPGAALRGDWGQIIIHDGCNVQENCTIHMFPGKTVVFETDAHVGHGAVIHGAHLGKNCLIGMNAVLMDGSRVGEGCIIGALAFVPADMDIPPRKIVVGNPAKILRDVDDATLDWKSQGTALYQTLAKEAPQLLAPVEPLHEAPEQQPPQRSSYQPLSETRK